MTCDVKSVELQTTRLLRSIVSRRVSLLLIDASVEAEKAVIAWNINIEEQLLHWVSNQLDEVINMLNELQSQQDLTLQLNEHWLLIQEDHKKRAKQLEVAFDKNDELEKKINQLQDERLNFRVKQRQVDRSMLRQDTQSAEQRVNQKVEWSSTFKARSQRKSSTLSENENDHHKFIKLLNSLIFIETDDSIWKTWNIKIADKLNVNANHYSTEKIHIVYVIFRLEDDADQQIYAKHHVDAFSLYQSLSELLKHLKEIYEDQNLIQKCRCKYVALKQLNKFFSSFYSEFTRIFSFLNYDNITLMNNIQNKINNHLQNALSVCLIKFSSLDKLKIFLQDVNNKQWVNYQLRDEQWTVKSIAALKKRFVSSSTSASASTTSYVWLATFSFSNLNDQECQSSASTAKYRVIFQRTALSWRLVLQHLMHSFLVSMRSSCRKKRRNYLQRNRRMRQKTSDFHQRRDERCVNFFNNEQLKWFFCFEIFDYWMCTI